MATGEQRFGCGDRDHDCGADKWTGLWPGEADCRRLGFLTPGGQPDLNRLARDAVWNAATARWERRPPDRAEYFTDGDRYDEQEEHAHTVAYDVLKRQTVKDLLRWAVLLPTLLFVIVGLRVVAVLALWNLSGPAATAVATLLVLDLLSFLRRCAGDRAAGRELTHEQIQADQVARVREYTARPLRDRMREWSWWAGKATTVAYLIVAGGQVAGWTDTAVALWVVSAALVVLRVGHYLLGRWTIGLATLDGFLRAEVHGHHDH